MPHALEEAGKGCHLNHEANILAFGGLKGVMRCPHTMRFDKNRYDGSTVKKTRGNISSLRDQQRLWLECRGMLHFTGVAWLVRVAAKIRAANPSNRGNEPHQNAIRRRRWS
jgi:hypothetical protein